MYDDSLLSISLGKDFKSYYLLKSLNMHVNKSIFKSIT